ncbi:MAG: SPOR domain-containing protein, partial [Nitrospira sp.]|nr:SPOR domain-containing protein [Nitrospira sp.]
SFVEMESAKKLVRKLTGKVYPAYLINTTVAEVETRYRVRVGSFVDKVKAKSVAEQLEKEEALKSFITFLEKGSQ